MKNLITPLLMATALIATACTNTNDIDTPDVDPSGKTPISFSVEESHSPRTRAGFTADTKIAMRIKSEKTENNVTTARYTRTVASGVKAETGKDYSKISVDEAYVRYWDDAYGRAAKISVFAIAVPGKTGIVNDTKTLEEKLTAGTTTWFEETTENEKISWKVSNTQTAATLVDEDITYSNNIKKGGENGVYKYDFTNSKYPDYSDDLEDGQMMFRLQNVSITDGPGKFDKGHLVFNHALSRITVNLIKGDGFASGPFAFTSGNVNVLNVPVKGDLNLVDGTWSNKTIGTIDNMVSQEPTGTETYSLMAQMLPDYEISKTGTTTNMLTFIIDNNQYNVTQAQMYDALKDASGMTKKDDSKIIMEQGINYVFKITVGKTGVSNVTATVVPFAEVKSGNITPDNARITLSLHSFTGDASSDFALYRALDESPSISDTYEGYKWDGKYEGPATLNDKGNNVWSTNWFFESNKAYYHFRLVNKTGVNIISKDNDNNDVPDYFTISSGSTDYHWGAPMKDMGEPVYEVDKGYYDYIYKAIGASSGTIAITDLHVMSNIKINLSTTGDNDKDKVTLAGSKVYITRFAKDGTVLMGTGLVTPSNKITLEQVINGNDAGTEFTYSVVPQTLIRNASTTPEYVGLTIVTGDGNQYFIDNLSTITATSVVNEKNQTQGAAITRWFPGHSYTYNFTLKKSGISSVTCTVKGWVNVTADNKDVTL